MSAINLIINLRKEKASNLKGGLYHKTQITMSYNSNRIEGSKLTEEQTRFIFETQTIGFKNEDALPVDDIIETVNHFKAFDYMLEIADKTLTEEDIKKFHKILKNDTSDDKKGYAVGGYKTLRNEVGGRETVPPRLVSRTMKELLAAYKKIKKPELEDIVKFHKRFEAIHPFQDGNGRVGRLIMFKECLKNNIMPFIILDKHHKQYYYRGLAQYDKEPGFLIGTCRSAQDIYENWVEYFYGDAKKTGVETAAPKQTLSPKQFTRYLIDLISIVLNKNSVLNRREINALIRPELPPEITVEESDRIINDLLTKMRREKIITNAGSRKASLWRLGTKKIEYKKSKRKG
jgi:Fic family protein